MSLFCYILCSNTSCLECLLCYCCFKKVKHETKKLVKKEPQKIIVIQQPPQVANQMMVMPRPQPARGII